MSVAITGATGLVGRFMVQGAIERGKPVLVLGRDPENAFSEKVRHAAYQLGDTPDLGGVTTLIHCAFDHLPGRYRGGEGDDPERFIQRNFGGSIALFKAAKQAGVRRVIFMSSRAVYGDYPAGTLLHEDLPPKPDTLYGQVKWDTEQALMAICDNTFIGQSLRATGVYGTTRPGQAHKWQSLFEAFYNRAPIAPRQGTEVHGTDVANAIWTLEHAPSGPFNVSDILLDRRVLLGLLPAHGNALSPLPAATHARYSEMATDKLRAYGWAPGGFEKLRSWLDTHAMAMTQ